MTYTPINWQTGDTITAEKLNKMDKGWSVETSSEQLFSETVTTVDDGGTAWGEFAYSSQITSDTATVTFDGTDYVCARNEPESGTFVYGGWDEGDPDFTNYPFAIVSSIDLNEICTETVGTHTVSVVGTIQSIETSEQFKEATDNVVNPSTILMECVSGTTTLADMQLAYGSGRILFFRPYMNLHILKYITGFTDTSVDYIPDDTQITVSIANGIFSVTTV